MSNGPILTAYPFSFFALPSGLSQRWNVESVITGLESNPYGIDHIIVRGWITYHNMDTYGTLSVQTVGSNPMQELVFSGSLSYENSTQFSSAFGDFQTSTYSAAWKIIGQSYQI